MHRLATIACSARPLAPALPAVPRIAVRSYALSRYRDADRAGKAASRLARRRSAAEARTASSKSPGALDKSTKELASDPSPTPQASKPFWASYDTYTPTEQAAEETNVAPPPVAPGDLLDLNHDAAAILSQPSLVICRQLEMMNVFLGYEQANRYRIVNSKGEDVGFLAEQEGGFGSAIGRQIMRGHRPFTCVVLDTAGNVVLRVNRPFSFINSRISISKGSDLPGPDNKIGECQQIWHPYRRKYALFQRYRDEDDSTRPAADNQTTSLTVADDAPKAESYTQFAAFDSRLLAWDFYLQSETGEVLGSVNRNFMGFGREIFTDTGQYVLRFDKGVADQEIQTRLEKGVGVNDELKSVADATSDAQEHAVVKVEEGSRGLTLDQRAILLAAAVTIDIDYFSRQGGGGMHMPMLWMPMPSGGSAPPADVPPGESVPSEGVPSGSGSPEDAPMASPEYGDSPGVDFSSGGGFDSVPSDSSLGDVMQDPWGGPQQQGGEGGSWTDTLGDFFGGGE